MIPTTHCRRSLHELFIGPAEARQGIYYLNVSSITMCHGPSPETFQRNDANWPLIRKFDVIYMITIGLNKSSEVKCHAHPVNAVWKLRFDSLC